MVSLFFIMEEEIMPHAEPDQRTRTVNTVLKDEEFKRVHFHRISKNWTVKKLLKKALLHYMDLLDAGLSEEDFKNVVLSRSKK